MKIYDVYVSMTNGKVHRNITKVSPVQTIDNETHWKSLYIYLNRNTTSMDVTTHCLSHYKILIQLQLPWIHEPASGYGMGKYGNLYWVCEIDKTNTWKNV